LAYLCISGKMEFGKDMKYLDICFTVNEPDVVHETFDDEVVIINLRSGNYYSLLGSAEFVWNCLSKNYVVNAVVEDMKVLFSGYTESLAGDIERFVDSLLDEKLIVIKGEKGDCNTKTITSVEAKIPYIPPALSRFTDMQELLLLDPIHEVDDQGWPLKK
jgi:hypothetical protein